MQIPRISFKELEAGDSDGLAAACRDWGFFRLTDHPISAGIEQRFLETSAGFFNQAKLIKNQVRRTGEEPWGYYDEELTKNRQDWKEIYDMGVTDTPWPAGDDNFHATMLDWIARCEEISLVLLKALAGSLGQAQDALDRYFVPSNTSFLRLNYYPVCPTPDQHQGIYHHTDAGALTLLLQDQVAGLQVEHGGSWHTVEPEACTLVINIGDMVQVWSNDEFKAPLHQVLANSAEARYSAAFFYNPTYATNVTPFSRTPRYRSINWGEFRGARAAGDYADIGEEIQISAYKL